MIKRCLLVALFISLFSQQSFASAIVPSTTGSGGSSVSLLLQESDPITISGISLSVDYDRSLFTLNDVTAGTDLISLNPVIFFAPDPSALDMVFVALQSDLMISGTTNLLNFLFSVSPSAPIGNYSIQFSCAFGAGSCSPDYGPTFSGQIAVESSISSSVPEPSILSMLMVGSLVWLLSFSKRRLRNKC